MYTFVTDDNIREVLARLEAYSGRIGIDTETTGFNVRNGVDYLMGVCYALPGYSGYIPFRHRSENVSKQWVEPLFDVLSEKALCWHNRKFDWHSIRTLGVDPEILRGQQFDSLILATLNNEEDYSKELDFLAKRYLGDQKYQGDEIHKMGEIYGWSRIPAEVMGPYGAQDADLTRRLVDELWPRIVEQGLDSVYWDTESPFTSSLYRMERAGVGVNSKLALDLATRGRSRMGTIQRELKFNPASPVDLGHYLLDELGLPVLAKTPKGKPSFNKVAMEGYDDILQHSQNPTARLVAEYRGWQKATTALYEPLLERIGPDGRIRTNFHQHRTVTGRLSASDPNLQQVPRGSNKKWNGHAKECFTSGREDYLLYGWDYSQVELRLAAAYGSERTLLEVFDTAGTDPFEVYCRILFGNFTPEGRYTTKTFFYANLYGAGLEKIAATLGWSVAKTEPVFKKFRASISGIAQASATVNNVMKQRGYITYWDGRRRHIRFREDQHKAWNSCIQGGAAQMVKQAVLRCEEFADDTCYPVLTVHDEITFIIHKDAIPDYEPLITAAMCDWPKFPVKFAIEGKSWG